MNRTRSKPDRPFRLLLYLEWLLLSLSLTHAVLPLPNRELGQASLLTILCVIGFGLMGLRLPTRRLSFKLLYTALEFGIFLLPMSLDQRIRLLPFTPFLGIIILIRSCQMFSLPGRLTVAGLVYVAFALDLFGRDLPRNDRPPVFDESGVLLLKLNIILSIGLLLVFVLLLVNSLLTERQSRQQLTIAHEKLRRYALRIEDQATLQERNRIAREIHDSLGHSLTAQSIQLENALLFCSNDAKRAQVHLLLAQELGAKALQEVRQSVSALRSNPLRGKTLKTALAHVIDEFRSMTGIVPDCSIELLATVPPEVSTALYRIVQEALTNICKHSAATRVSIELQEKMGAIVLRIADDGRGFNPELNTSGFGIQGMRERTLALGGQFDLVSQPGQGCLVEVIVPMLLREWDDYDSGVIGGRPDYHSAGTQELAGR